MKIKSFFLSSASIWKMTVTKCMCSQKKDIKLNFIIDTFIYDNIYIHTHTHVNNKKSKIL